jgi:DNA-binding IclR family transcriptional regulator
MVKSADRTLEILEALADTPHRPGLSELAQQLGIPKSSLHAILRTMAARGWVDASDDGLHFGLGLRALRAGLAYIEGDDTVTMMGPLLDDLAHEFGETVHMGRLDAADIVYLAKRDSVHPLRLFSAVGRRLPAHATALGKALLARRSAAEVDRIIGPSPRRLTANTIVGRTALRTDLAATRERGFAIDREENSEGVVCLAVALPLATDDAVSISVPTTRLDTALERRLADSLTRLVDVVRGRRLLISTSSGPAQFA